MRWYDRQPSHFVGRLAHYLWFRSWNQIDEIGGGGWWLPITRRLGWNQKGEYEWMYWVFLVVVPLAYFVFLQIGRWIADNLF